MNYKKLEKEELTDIRKRRAGISLLSRNLDKMKSMKKNIIVTFINVDGLKHINKNFRHIKGNDLFKIVSNILKENISKDDNFFRYGDDDVIVAFCNIDRKHAKKIIESVGDKILKLYMIDIYMI